jgi:hypothetical protein
MELKRKNLLFQITIFSITFIVAFFATQYLMKIMKSDSNELEKVAAEINKSCPVLIDKETRLDKVVLKNDTVFQYHYTLVNIENKDKNFDVEKIKQYVKSQSQENLDLNAAMKYQRENKIELKYVYNDKSNHFLFDFTIRHEKNKLK